MENEEHQQKRTEFETTVAELPEEERTAKLTEWDEQNPLPAKADGEDYRGKLNAQNRFLEKEGYEFKDGKWVKKPAAPVQPVAPTPGLTVEDGLAIARAQIHEDDQDTVVKWAKTNGLSVADALKDKDLKIILDAHSEERRTAAATHTTGGARGGSKISGDDLLRKAETTGELPDTDEGMAALATARQGKLTKKKH